MLVADLNGQRIEATEANKGPEYHCSQCKKKVILKKGRIVVHHFAHEPGTTCRWAKGETREHLEAKQLFKEEFIRRELRVEVEYEVHSLYDDRRADVVIWSPKGQPFALELQHSPIDYDNIELRTRSYLNAGVPVIWIPFLRPKLWEQAEGLNCDDYDFLIERYPARPLDKWANGFNFGQFWMYDPKCKKLFQAKLFQHNLYVEESSWYDSSGDEQYAGGYSKPSKKWRELKLKGPYSLDQVGIRPVKRQEREFGTHKYPGGMVGEFVIRDPAIRRGSE